MVNGIGNYNDPYGGFIAYNPILDAASLNRQKRRELFKQHHEKEKKSNAFTKAVAGTAIGVGILGLIFARAGSGNFSKYLNKLVQKADDLIYHYQVKMNSKKPLNLFQKTSLFFVKGYKFALEKAGMINNFTAFKDSGFMRLAEKWHFVKACNATTNWFKSVSIKASRGHHLEARGVIDKHCAVVRNITKTLSNTPSRRISVHGEIKTAAEWAEDVERMLGEMEQNYTKASSTPARDRRIAGIDNHVKGLREKVYNEIFTRRVLSDDPAKFRLYRTEALSARGKEAFTDEILTLRREFSNNVSDNYNSMSDALNAIRSVVKTSDDKALNISRELSNLIAEYKGYKGPTEKMNRDRVIEKIKTEIIKLKSAFGAAHYSDTTRSLFRNKISELTDVLEKGQKGKAEKIETILRRCLTPSEYLQARTSMHKMTKSVKKAYEEELKLYDKIAELEVGSAPTDVLFGLIMPVGGAAYAVAQGENKDEKIAASLKSGIPIVSGILTTLYCTVKMMTNMQGIVLGLITGTGFNILGSAINDKYIKYQKNKIFTQKAIAEYKKKFQ